MSPRKPNRYRMRADWNVGFGELEMAVLAKDDRDLLNLHFTLPAMIQTARNLKSTASSQMMTSKVVLVNCE